MELSADLIRLLDPVPPARERTLPVAEMFDDLFVERGLVRGRIIACSGPAATSLALALVAAAIAEGAWLAVIDVPSVGLDAAGELGIPLERVVAVRTDGAARWADVVAAAADGFDLLLVRVPAGVPPATMRKVATRVRHRDAVAVVLGDPGALECDGVLGSESIEWSGLGEGHGHLRQRRLVVEASGRRLHGHRRCRLMLP